MAYESTTVSVSSSQEHIRKVLRGHGAVRTAFGESYEDTDDETAAGHAAVEFVHQDTMVRVFATLRRPAPKVIADKVNRSRSKDRATIEADLIEQEAKRIWRVLHWTIKARMEAVSEGLETFEQAFLPHIVDPATDRTLWERIQPVVESGALRIGGSGLRALGAGSSS